MKLETLTFAQPLEHYSLIGLMYGHQFNRLPDEQKQDSDSLEALKQQDLVSHIEDFCDCV